MTEVAPESFSFEPESFSFEAVRARRQSDLVRRPLRQTLVPGEAGTLIVAAVPNVVEVAHGFGFLGLRDSIRFLHEFVAGWLPASARLSSLAWFVAVAYVPEAALRPETLSIMREAFRATDLELGDGRFVTLELAIGTTQFDGVDLTGAVAQAVEEANFDILVRVRDQDGDIFIVGPDFHLSVPPEHRGQLHPDGPAE